MTDANENTVRVIRDTLDGSIAGNLALDALLSEHAAELDRLRQEHAEEVEHLAKEAGQAILWNTNQRIQAERELVEARAENERLRQGLEDIAHADRWRSFPTSGAFTGWLIDTARAALAAAQEPPAETNHCEECDDTGCLCLRTRDWQSIESGCHAGCPYCKKNSCKPPAEGGDR